jgi:hypothetical protein
MEKIYRVVFQGLVVEEEAFRERMSGMGVPAEVVARLVRSAPVEMKRDLSLRDARAYADAVQGAGGKVAIQEHGRVEEERHPDGDEIPSLGAFAKCPECGMKQLRKGRCERCGCPLEP